jgi:hypothetical protein
MYRLPVQDDKDDDKAVEILLNVCNLQRFAKDFLAKHRFCTRMNANAPVARNDRAIHKSGQDIRLGRG